MNHHHRLLATVIFSLFLLGLISLSLGGTNPGIAAAAALSVAILAANFHFVLPGSTFFSAVFANSIGVYACVFVFFLDQNFPQAGSRVQEIGFVLPLLGFLAGVLWRRREIAADVVAEEGSAKRQALLRAMIWGAPLVIVGTATTLIPIREIESPGQEFALLTAMLIIALAALLAARDIASFLLSTAILSEDFFTNAARLAKPAFAFFTVYSLLVLVFGCFHTILDQYSATANFLAGGVIRKLSFGEGLYLSIVTLSTVGYGDLIAQTTAARALVGAEICFGVLLLLFGVQAILSSGQKQTGAAS